MIYSIIRPLLFKLDPETAHDFALTLLKRLDQLRLTRLLLSPIPAHPVSVMGISFPNRVGLAAGWDNNGDYIDALASLAAGFIEIGGVSPDAQPGNPRQRIYRLTEANGIINRMGFPNKGVDYLTKQIQTSRYQGVLGANITKNKTTELSNALIDYVRCLQTLYTQVDYFTINFSSPNTPGLRDLANEAFVGNLLEGIKTEQTKLAESHQSNVPLLVKLSPDMTDDELKQLLDQIIKHKFDGLVVCNTTVNRVGVEGVNHSDEPGGLSGAPLTERALSLLKTVKQHVGNQLAIIACGGIMSGEDAKARIEAGADLVQVYSGCIFRGPGLLKEISETISSIRP